MIRFFRKIKQSLLAEGKTGAYLKYAVGETVLVVIGILIALQINNWNAERKYRAQEKDLLEGIKEDLLESKKEIEETISLNDSTVYRYRYILKNFENNEGVTPELKTALGWITNWASPYLTYTTFESLKSKGLDLISDKALRKKIIAIYDSQFAFLMEDYDRVEWTISENVCYPLTNKLLRTSIDDPYSAVPNDYDALRTNDEFINMTHRLITVRQKGVNRSKVVVSIIYEVIEDIDDAVNEMK
ncbi:hypothetical protein HZ996_05845 [Cryomorphaceae bacterium]|nr:hypothetical protein HZ996_05845 [Cryomorphaceae bacterium]